MCWCCTYHFRLNYLRGTRIINENIVRALTFIHERDLSAKVEDENKEFTYLSALLLSIPRDGKCRQSNFSKLVSTNYFSRVFTGKYENHKKEAKPHKIKIEWDSPGEERSDLDCVFVEGDVVRLQFTESDDSICISNRSVASNVIAYKPTEKWNVLHCIREWRNKYLGHPKLVSISISKEDLDKVCELATEFHQLFDLDDSYKKELQEILECNYPLY